MKIYLTGMILCVLVSKPVTSQDLIPVPTILGNSIANLHADQETIWVGPHLNLSSDGGQSWGVVNSDSLAGLKNTVYSIDIEGNVIWVGLGDSNRQRSGGGRGSTIHQTAGLLNSMDGGLTWNYISYFPRQSEDPTTTGLLDFPDDTLVVYGDNKLWSIAATVPELSPPWDIDYDQNTGDVWVASQVAGLRKSSDNGQTWKRIVLPPDTSKFISPDLDIDFPFFSLPEPAGITPVDFRGYNFLTYSVLVDELGTVWVGTLGGLNISDDGGRSWKHLTAQDGLLGNVIFSIEEQARPSLPPAIWFAHRSGAATSEAFESQGISVTRDRGETFEHALYGHECFDFAFDWPSVYVACETGGLFISRDDGSTFTSINQFQSNQSTFVSLNNLEVLSVALTNGILWVGTNDGLFRSMDGAHTWNRFRANVPLNPSGLPPNVSPEQVPEVSTYAYPNPFSPYSDGIVRIRYDLETTEQVAVRIFDFGMKLIRTIVNESQSQGIQEVVWNGTDDSGIHLANGPYFYEVKTQNDRFMGKILIVH